MQHFNGLSPAEAERLGLLVEEAAEVIQAATKILRHGYDSHNPHDPDSIDNRRDLEKEIGHFEHAVDRLLEAGDVNELRAEQARQHKAETIGRWLHHQDPQ